MSCHLVNPGKINMEEMCLVPGMKCQVPIGEYYPCLLTIPSIFSFRSLKRRASPYGGNEHFHEKAAAVKGG